MAKKVRLDFESLKFRTGNGDSVKTIDFITKQKIGKVEFSVEKYNYADFAPATFKGTDKDKDINVKFVVDFDNKKYIKVVDGVTETTPETMGELITDLIDLIKSKTNKYTSVYVYQRSVNKLSEMVRRIIKEEIETTLAPGEVFVKFGSHRSRDYAERALGQLPRALISFTSGYQLYKLTADQLQRLEGNKRVIKTVYKKLPPNHEWQNTWS